MKEYKVLVTTSGLGQRLGNLTSSTNKALVRVGKKPVISYIVEAYPKDVEMVITLGYFGNQVKDFLELVYPDRKFNFVTVDKYHGKGSSLGYSMLQARNELQTPFIYHASDTLVSEDIPLPINKNWIGGYRGGSSVSYASFNVVNNQVRGINDKGALDYDYLHIGLVGIKDYHLFWDSLFRLYKTNSNSSTLNDSQTINEMLKQGVIFGVREFHTWLDTGNVEGLLLAREKIYDKFENLDKRDEAVYIFDDSVIKFYSDATKIKKKVKRGMILSQITPKIVGAKDNFFKYKYQSGSLYSEVAYPEDFKKFLAWSKNKLWHKNGSNKKFKQACKDFYFTKTQERVEMFLKDNSLEDTTDIINSIETPSVKSMLNKIDKKWMTDGEEVVIHGDLILENIIKTGNSYKLVDWREDFGGLIKTGDLYYDLAKLNHNLTVNHDIINQNLYTIENNNSEIVCDIYRKHRLVECQNVLYGFIVSNGYDLKKVKTITALIWLNMSPLHHYPFNVFLYYFGKYHLWQEIK